MSREVRRVPVDWQHPIEHNPHWQFQQSSPFGRSQPASRLHGKTERFVSLCDDYPGALARWEEELADLEARRGHSWTFSVEYHLTGYQGQDDDAPTIHPHHVWSEDGETTTPVTVRDEDHLHELLLADHRGSKPDPADYMPVFDVPAEDLGWCLYQTVSEGTPVTPVFATAEELVDHLCTVGQDWDQVPMRRAAAEALVRNGSSLGSMVVAGGVLYQSDRDADQLDETALRKQDRP